MMKGTPVIRISRNDTSHGPNGERGKVEKVYRDEQGEPFGYYIVWDARPSNAEYVAPQRIREDA